MPKEGGAARLGIQPVFQMQMVVTPYVGVVFKGRTTIVVRTTTPTTSIIGVGSATEHSI
jgi:hypothetical protein